MEDHLEKDEQTIVLVLTIEGLHVLHNDYDNPDKQVAMANVREIK
jgi:hypothetical protein